MGLSRGVGEQEVGAGGGAWGVKEGVLVWLTIQNSVHTLIIRYSRARKVPHMFLPSCAVFWTEIVKLVVCVLAVIIEQRGGIKRALSMIHEAVFMYPTDTIKVCIPCFLYTLQNNLFYVAASNLDAATFMITSQLKIFTTAIFYVILLKKRLLVQQWIALAMLFAGVSIVQIHQQQTANAVPSNAEAGVGKASFQVFKMGRGQPVGPAVNPLFGFVCIVLACTLSGLAGVYFEKILKSQMSVSVWMRNLQMAFFSIPMSYTGIWLKDGVLVRDVGILYGFDAVVWFTVCWYGIGGLTVAVCIKYADNILKTFSTSVAIIISTVASVYVFHFTPTPLFLLGASLVTLAILLYSATPFSSRPSKDFVQYVHLNHRIPAFLKTGA